ncbi:MAG TPA: hypothetical protein PLI09_10810 [Candidatus Hydrogenedentes bacterium]|nr:hypothetical protein [Candidatus Hydrogenedentota bacterium]
MSLNPSGEIPVQEFAGDPAGARRSRRAFRFAVAACVFFAFSMWFAEGYLRFSMLESQYRMALTLPIDSARAILRNVVKRDNGQTPKYLEALASIEESDVILSRYEEAYKSNPNNPFLIIKYGCRLFLAGQYKEARERFREAGIQLPKNALPRYLEAAALALSMPEDGDLSEVLALVARTNSSGAPVLFPQPLWHSSLPRSGVCYTKLRRDIADLCCAPLYKFKNLLIGRARPQIEAGRLGDWDSWMDRLQGMGEKLVGDRLSDPANLGTPQAMAGFQIQLDVLQVRKQINEMAHGAVETALLEKEVRIKAALNDIKSFENTRAQRIENDRRLYVQPLRLSANTVSILLIIYLLALGTGRLMRTDRKTWVVPHTHLGKGMLLAGLCMFLVYLALFSLFQTSKPVSAYPLHIVTGLWYGLFTFLVLFGLAYPALALYGMSKPAPENLQGFAAMRRAIFFSLIRRYFGILLGGFLCVVCIWCVAYRLGAGVYPMQLELLVTGLETMELDTVRRVQELLL